KHPSQKEINLLFLYYLYAIVRTLISSFITNNTNYYMDLLNQQNMDISIEEYLRAYDWMEDCAFKLYSLNLQNRHIFNFLNENDLQNKFINGIYQTELMVVENYQVNCVIP
ncbi:hypothetical protein Mgra_00009646, partial [Meloidogyne graminicola]